MDNVADFFSWLFILAILFISGFVMYGITFDHADDRKRIDLSKPAKVFIFLVACVVFVVTLVSTILLIIYLIELS